MKRPPLNTAPEVHVRILRLPSHQQQRVPDLGVLERSRSHHGHLLLLFVPRRSHGQKALPTEADDRRLVCTELRGWMRYTPRLPTNHWETMKIHDFPLKLTDFHGKSMETLSKMPETPTTRCPRRGLGRSSGCGEPAERTPRRCGGSAPSLPGSLWRSLWAPNAPNAVEHGQKRPKHIVVDI